MKLKLRLFYILLILGLFFFSCSQEDDIIPDNDGGDSTTISERLTVNEWILESMQLYYFWNDEIPSNTNLSLNPADYFNSLLFRFDAVNNPEGDRFSFISEDAEELISSLSGEVLATGMELRLLFKEEGSNEIIAQVTYTHDDSPADLAGIKRGDIITRVNGITLTDQNFRDLLFSSSSLSVTLAERQDGVLVDTNEEILLSETVFQENPIHLDTVLDINGQKIAYLVYNQFIPSPNNTNNNEFDNRLNQIFENFKSTGASELIVDLRYNPGGFVSSAVTLASLIAPGVSDNDLFYRQGFNDELQEELNQEFGSDFFNENFRELSGNIGNQINRVFFLVSGSSASASELVINGLLPYMNVTLIGERTVGKNVGSITITDDENEENNWALQPIVMKSFNSEGNSDYAAGFIPDIEVAEGRDLPPFGDSSDPLLGSALAVISGSARFAPNVDFNAPKVIENSASRKKVTLMKISSSDLIE